MTLLRWLLLPILMSALWPSGPAQEGRRGNALYERGAFARAEQAYLAGLAQVERRDSTQQAMLAHNRGAALYQQAAYARADSAFARAQQHANTKAARTRIRYNRATNAARAGNIDAALRHYRATLRLDPDHDAARHNYEVLARRAAATPQRRPAPDIAPSSYAQRLKRRAEALVAQRQYTRAFALMQDGLAEDSTVAAYQDFMGRLRAVAAINSDSTATVRRQQP